ncbi:MAG TPA: ATP-binding protein, partial [Anaerolineae bacterium]|nr:ATP-binding protein [Anaerolineae bacterium]
KLPPLPCDPHQITQILLNLLTNARDALAPQPGTITIRTAITHAHDALILEIHDSGPGIPPELLDKIFDPFFTTKPIGMGTGLGLPIVANLIARHHGRLTVGNHPNGGAIFTIHLPF